MPLPDNVNFDDLDAVRKVVDALSTFDPDQQQRILRWAREKLGLSVELATPAPMVEQGQPSGGPSRNEETHRSKSSNIRTFIESKNPSSDNQFAAAVAYFYRFEAPEHERKDAINKDDLLDACRQVGRNRISRPDQTLVNAHGQGLLDREEKGLYRINTVGENLVAVALPSDGRTTVTRATKKKSPSRKAVKKAASAKRPRRAQKP
jgi:hypothetical protein